MNYWLIKSEPGTWSWDDQVASPRKTTEWDGVKNHQANNNLKAMAKGDRCFFYHSVNEKCVVGIVEVTKAWVADPEQPDTLGSGSAGNRDGGGVAGGGAVRITAAGAMTLRGTVDVSGLDDDLDKTTFYPVDGAVNPYDRRAEIGAAPLSAPTPSTYRSAMLNPTGLMAFEETVLTHRIGLNAVRDQLRQSLAQTRAVLPVLHERNTYDPFEPEHLTLLGDCIADRVTPVWFAPNDPLASALVRLSCENYESGGKNTYWVVVPAID